MDESYEERQAQDRLHRTGKPLHVTELVTPAQVDDHVDRMLRAKGEVLGTVTTWLSATDEDGTYNAVFDGRFLLVPGLAPPSFIELVHVMFPGVIIIFDAPEPELELTEHDELQHCGVCNRPITTDEWVLNWTSCGACFDRTFRQFLEFSRPDRPGRFRRLLRRLFRTGVGGVDFSENDEELI